MNAAKASPAFGGGLDEGHAAPAIQTIASTSALSTNGSSTKKPSSSFKPRPARRQITQAKLEELRIAHDPAAQPGATFNVWFGNTGVPERTDSNRKADTRCDVARDVGYTRGDANKAIYHCLHFARGSCPLGVECNFLHRLPASNMTPDQGRDIFGREKRGDYKDDMGGTGSLQRMNRTLYIGRITEEPRESDRGGGANVGGQAGTQWRDGGRTMRGGKRTADFNRENPTPNHKPLGGIRNEDLSSTERVLKRHFSEWGDLERVRVLHGRGCGFVTYQSEPSAQFAKEAMAHQALDHGEVLNVRWATEDPNPSAARREIKRITAQGQERLVERTTEEQWEAALALRMLEDEGTTEVEGGSEEQPQQQPLQEEQPQGEEDDYARGETNKRRKVAQIDDEEMKRLIEENERGWREIEEQRQAVQEQNGSSNNAPQQIAAPPPAPAPSALLSSDALAGLGNLQALRNVATKAPVKKAPLATLAGYGSESDED